MYCERCGTKLQERPNFCSSCGRTIAHVPLMPVRNRLSGHTRLLAIFWMALSAFRMIPGIFLVVAFGSGYAFLPHDLPFFVPPLLHTVGMLLMAGSVLGIMTGWGLLEHRAWARTASIWQGFINLLDMPFGTALGVYTLWVMLPAQSGAEYRSLRRVEDVSRLDWKRNVRV